MSSSLQRAFDNQVTSPPRVAGRSWTILHDALSSLSPDGHSSRPTVGGADHFGQRTNVVDFAARVR